MNKKLYKYVDHICNKMKLGRKTREVLKSCNSKSEAKRLIRRHKEVFNQSLEPSLLRKAQIEITESIERSFILGEI